MKICWDNLEGVYLSKKGNLKKGSHTLYEKICLNCGEPFLGRKSSKYCSNKCAQSFEENRKKRSKKYKGKNNPFYGKKHSVEVKEKLSKIRKGTKNPDHSQRISNKNNPNWKGGYTSKNIPLYDTYAKRMGWCEDIRRNDDDTNILEVKCAYCGRWFVPTLNSVHNRVNAIEGNIKHNTECRLYCSEGCKKECPIYGKHVETLIREDAIRAGRMNWIELNREVQPELRQLVLERDDYTCQKCGETEYLHCHHILPESIEPIESADIDNCITYCKDCHKEAHQQDGCRYGQLRACIE